MDFDDIHDGPFVVLSDGFNFDYAEDCEIAYITKKGYESLEQQNGRNIIQGYFDVVEVDDIHSVRLSEILKFYFENHPDLDPMR
tara:strand:+ start:952 stop:1203 length:252 start_codon:yes stop_codon:yes gene_type:complete